MGISGLMPRNIAPYLAVRVRPSGSPILSGLERELGKTCHAWFSVRKL